MNLQSQDTQKRHYKKFNKVAGAAEAHHIVKNLTKGTKVKQTWRQYSNTEEVEITAHFSRNMP